MIEKIPVKITTSIPHEVFIDCKNNNWSWRDLILSGYRLRINKDEQPRRIAQLEAQVETLKKVLSKKEDKPIYRKAWP